MTTQRIIYENDDGGIAIIIPAVDVESALSAVPAGKEYRIVDAADIPSDRTFRNAWEWVEPTPPVEPEVTA